MIRKCLRALLIIIALFFIATPFYSQTRGKASYYSKRATGGRQSDGTRHHHDSLTCAHRTLPFGTMLKVTNVSNGKYVIVKVADRGPHARGRIIDLSYRAAKEIGMLNQGIALVEIEKYEEVLTPIRPDAGYHPREFDVALSQQGEDLRPLWQQNENHELKKTENKSTHKEATSSPAHKSEDRGVHRK